MNGTMIRRIILLVAILFLGARAHAQDLSYQDRLFYTCKVWGLVKYNHSQVSTCQVDWDSVLRTTLPVVKAATEFNAFNDALSSMISAAGPMQIASGSIPSPPPELSRNREFGWLDDDALRADVRAVLDTILTNFRPHEICWVNTNTGNGPYLLFPHDNPILNVDAQADFPDEFDRLFALFKYWNILSYLNPNIHILDTSWDLTLHQNVIRIATAEDYGSFFSAFKRITAGLDDAHVEGMTSSLRYKNEVYGIKIVLGHTSDGYTVLKSDVPSIAVGDILLSVDGRTVAQYEDSLRDFISAGNQAVFRRTISSNILRGPYYTPIELTYRDSLGVERSYSGLRKNAMNSSWHYDYYPNDTLANVFWKKWGCNVGYVHMGNLTPNDVDAMYADLRTTSAIIFDVRNYPRGTAVAIANKMFPAQMTSAHLMLPDVSFPGTYKWFLYSLGLNGNMESYKGRVIILCNEQTQSHAEWSCMILAAMPNTVIVGSQTAGADGNVTYFNLTQDIRTGFTSLGVYWPNGDNTQRIGIVPDSVVVPTVAGIRQGRDEVLEKALEIAGCVTGVSRDPHVSPAGYALAQNYPNPFNPSTTITYMLGHPGHVRLRITDMMGRPLRMLLDDFRIAGTHTVNVEASSLSSGSYRYILEINGMILSRTMTVIK